MANATTAVKKAMTDWNDSFRRGYTETLASETTFYVHAFVGIDETGRLCKGDDTQSWIFAGVVRGREGNPVIPAGTAGDASLQLDYWQPRIGQVAISGVAVTDIGKTVYADDDQTGTLSTSGTTYANVVGMVVGVAASGIAWVEFAYDGVAANTRLGAARRMAATGAQTLSVYDMGKHILVANTAALAITLPAVSSVPQGRGCTVVKDHASDTNAITLTSAGSDSIDGSATLATLDAPYDVVTIVSSNTNRWVATSRDIA